jgi:hypothetical protein
MSEQSTLEIISSDDSWTGNESIALLSADHGKINPRTSATPAVAYFSDSLLFTYCSYDETNVIWQCLYKDNIWKEDVVETINNKKLYTSNGPSLAVFNETLYMAYRSSIKIDGEYPIMLTTLASPTKQWQDGKLISIGGKNLPTDHAPSLTVQGTGSSATLWLGWQKDSDLFTATFDGTTWTNMGKIEKVASNGTPQSDYGPTLCGYGYSVMVIFKARHGDELMWASYNVITKEWSGNEDIKDKRGEFKTPKSNVPPGIALYNGSMYMTYKGEKYKEIYWAMLTNQAWSGNKQIYESSNIQPETDSTTGMTTALRNGEWVLILANKGDGKDKEGQQIYVSQLKINKATP